MLTKLDFFHLVTNAKNKMIIIIVMEKEKGNVSMSSKSTNTRIQINDFLNRAVFIIAV